MPPLAERSLATVPGATILADAGYGSERNHVFCREAPGVQALIPAQTCRYVAGPRGRYRAEMVGALRCTTLGVKARRRAGRTGQRWLVETLPPPTAAVSVVKRKWGERLTARPPAMQEAQALLRGLAYNVYRLVLLGVVPRLAGPRALQQSKWPTVTPPGPAPVRQWVVIGVGLPSAVATRYPCG